MLSVHSFGEDIMKRVSSLQLAISFVGLFLGAGFVSGQELWQFFACFGSAGLFGFLISVSLALLIDYALLRLSQTTGCTAIGQLILPNSDGWGRRLIDVMQCLLLLGIVVIMIAGASALLHDLTGLSAPVCGLLFLLVLFPAALFELRGIVTAFSVLVPITGVTAVVLGIGILFRENFQLAPAVGSSSLLTPTWWVSGVTYASYNLFGTIAILVPFASPIPDTKTIRRGLGLGALILMLLTFSILASLIAVPESGLAELPTAALAAQLHPVLGMGYNLLMGMGMFSSALATIIALLTQLGLICPVIQRRRRSFLVLFCLAGYLLSLLGFGNLVGLIYPLFGYLSVPFLFLLVRNWWKSKKTQKVF